MVCDQWLPVMVATVRDLASTHAQRRIETDESEMHTGFELR